MQIVKDNKYGNENRNGDWDGMVGELMRRVSELYFIRISMM